MKRAGSLLLVLTVAGAAGAQAPPCSTFDGGTLDGWTAINGTAVVASAGGREYADVRDGAGPSNFVAPDSDHGNWLQRTYGCGSLCFDVSVIDDGLPTSMAVRPYFVIEDAVGHSAVFQMSGVVEGSGWRTVCAPVAPLVDGKLPANGDGTWSYGANTGPADWEALLQNVQSFRLAIDFASSSAVSERLFFDDICFRPRTCAGPPPDAVPVGELMAAPIRTNWTDCPQQCKIVQRQAGETYTACNWTRVSPPGQSKGLMQYLPGTQNDRTCDPGTPLDVEPRHRLFVHGIHADHWTWDKWIQRVKPQMDYLGFRTVADNTGYTDDFGEGSASLLTQVDELATQINDGFGAVPDGSVWVYAHSLGALKMEALLQKGYDAGKTCGFGSGCTDPHYLAAKKIGQVFIFQGAHGGCSVTSLYGDRPYHGLFRGPCPASLDIGFVNDSRLLPDFSRTIPGSTTVWDMTHIVWKGRGAQEKHITYVVATAKAGGKVCKGGAGIICDDDRGLHDGVVYAEQMIPPYLNYQQAVDGGYVTVKSETPFCHIADDTYDPPRLSTGLMVDYVGLKQGPYDYYVGKPVVITVETEIATCSQGCFCGLNRPAACASKIDCTRFELPPFQPCISLGSSQPPSLGEWLRLADGSVYQQGGLLTSWIPCAAEGAVCSVPGTRFVRYGGGDRYTLRTISSSTPCTSAVFGDPAPGIAKRCEYQGDPASAPFRRRADVP